ncbi:MAG TPA: DUF6607 family protein [Flavipsychrobacter sp.]|nr:DUF6607 family protein [Flavipsychrobacter sp.]
MTKGYIALAAAALLTTQVNAQQDGKKLIEQLCGCYDVTFTYAETFAPDSNYKFHERETAHARELIIPIEKTDKKIVLQHMLVVSDNYIIKHWREDWVYESPELLNYKGNNTWTKEKVDKKEVAGKWTQTVWQVDDMPRYQGYSAWIDNNGKTYWENTAYAPLPRREYTTRSDYNLMRRTNRIIPVTNGWIHEQDNDKIIRTAKGDSLLVQEKGMNIYNKIDDSKCAKALAAWEGSKEFWVVVRKEWQSYVDKQSTLVVKETVDDEKLYEHLYVIEAEWKEKKLSEKQLTKQIKDLFERFVSDKTTALN